jgi:hypothetical protein
MSSENVFYKSTVKLLQIDQETGKQKKLRHEYIVEAISPTDVDAKINTELEGYDFDIHSLTQTKILETVKSTNEDDEWYKVVIKTEYEDAKGRVKTRKEEYLVQGNCPTDVETRIHDHLGVNDFEAVQISQTRIVDIIK